MKNRQRGRNGGKPRPGGGGRNPNFDGNAGRMRGNAQQLMEKFLAMARDASSAGDRVLAENYFQHADHYYRVLNARFEQQNGQGQQPQHNQQHPGQGYPQGQRPHGNDDNRGNQADYNQDRRYDNNPGNYGQQEHHAQPQHPVAPPAPQPAPQVQDQPQRQPEGDIGLPPGILGIAPAAPAEAQGAEDERGRQPQGHRRRGGPAVGRDRSPADVGE